ncbi:unnamed protein product [Schistosoma mattheei]|uniref:Uncharacterized protein n=1 Tax=Schistosoma mattheei TaxID=31246 RepID=A0A183P3H8_9TREM|nr:unnamed protein product [Schistosoma mattheei]
MPNCSFQGVSTARIDYKVVNELDIQSTKISNTLLSCHDEIQSQGQSDLRSFNSDSYSRVNMKGVSTWNNKANHKGEIKFGKCLSCGKFHSRNSCAFRNAKSFKCVVPLVLLRHHLSILSISRDRQQIHFDYSHQLPSDIWLTGDHSQPRLDATQQKYQYWALLDTDCPYEDVVIANILSGPSQQYYRGNDLRPSTGTVPKNVGKSVVRNLDIDDFSTNYRHADQMQFQEPGHVMVFTWKNGCEPEHIEGSDDFVPFLLQQEKMKVNQLSMELSQNVFTDSNVPSELNEILWDGNEVGAIDFGPFDVESVENIEIERENMVSTSSSGTPDNPNVDSASQSNVQSSINERKPIVASGASARYLLDSVDGRQALLNDLLELNAFLQRFQEDLLERLDNENEHQLSRTGCNAFKPSGGIGCDTIQNIIIQNAPNDLSYTSNDISRMIELVKEALNKLTTSSLSQLMMIRTRIGYLDRLTDRLLDYRRQVELARTRCSQTQKLIDKALMEQQEKTTQLAQLKNYCKKLTTTPYLQIWCRNTVQTPTIHLDKLKPNISTFLPVNL